MSPEYKIKLIIDKEFNYEISDIFSIGIIILRLELLLSE